MPSNTTVKYHFSMRFIIRFWRGARAWGTRALARARSSPAVPSCWAHSGCCCCCRRRMRVCHVSGKMSTDIPSWTLHTHKTKNLHMFGGGGFPRGGRCSAGYIGHSPECVFDKLDGAKIRSCLIFNGLVVRGYTRTLPPLSDKYRLTTRTRVTRRWSNSALFPLGTFGEDSFRIRCRRFAKAATVPFLVIRDHKGLRVHE